MRRLALTVAVVLASVLIASLTAEALAPGNIIPISATFAAKNHGGYDEKGCGSDQPDGGTTYVPLVGTSTSSQAAGHLSGRLNLFMVTSWQLASDDGPYEKPSGTMHFTVTSDPFVTDLRGSWVGSYTDTDIVQGSGVIEGRILRNGKPTGDFVRTSAEFTLSYNEGQWTITGALGGPMSQGAGYAVGYCGIPSLDRKHPTRT